MLPAVSVHADIRRSVASAAARAVESLRSASAARKGPLNRSHSVEPLESRQYLTAVTLTGPGTGGTAFLASLNSSTGNIDFSVSGTVVQSAVAASVSSVVIDDSGSGDTLTVNAAGTSFSVDGSGTSALTLVVDQGAVTLSATQSLDNVEVSAGTSLTLAGNVTLNGLTVDGAATHSSGTLTANVLNVDNSYTDAGGTTASGITINNTGTFIAAYAGSLAGITGTFNNSGTFIENVASGSSISTGITFNNTAGTIDLAGAGAMSLSNSLTLSSGQSLTLSGSGTLSLPLLDDAGGSVVQSGVTVQAASGVWVGDNTLGATYHLDSGTIDTPELDVAYVHSSYTLASGTFYQDGGSVNLTNKLFLGYGYANVAGYVMTAGTITANEIDVGSFSSGTFTQSGGTISTAGTLYVGCVGLGTFTQTGGNDSFGYVEIGPWGGTGTYTLSGGSMTTNGGWLWLGEGGGGTFNLSGAASLTAYVEALGGTDTSTAGRTGLGTFNQTGGTNSTTTVFVGEGNSAVGSYTLSGGTLNCSVELIGYNTSDGIGSSQGVFTQTGGVNACTGGVGIGFDGATTGLYSMAGGSFSVPWLPLGAGGQGTFAQTAGTTDIDGTVMVGDTTAGALSLAGGSFSVDGNLYVGYDAAGTLTQSAGSLDVTDNLYVSGDGYDGDPAGVGTLDLSGSGSVDADDVFVGYSGPGTLDQAGGTLAVMSYLALGGPSGAVGTHEFTGGAEPDPSQIVDVLQPAASGVAFDPEGTPYTLDLSATSNVGNNAITGWAVAWGDGDSSNPAGSATSASHSYTPVPASYSITSTATGGNKTYAGGTVALSVTDVPAQFNAIADQSVNTGSPLSLSIPFTYPGPIETHTAEISWGDGTFTQAAVNESNGVGTITASHTYQLHRTYTASVQATDNYGQVGQQTFNVTANYVAPTLSVTAPTAPVTSGQPVTLQLHDHGPETTGVTQWTVDWNDGSTTTINTATTPPTTSSSTDAVWDVSHTYAEAGDYWPAVTATDSVATYSVDCGDINVVPAVDISGAATVAEFGVYTLNLATAGTDYDSVDDFIINWGDGSDPETVDGPASSDTHTFAAGTASAQITATADDDNQNTLTAPETVDVTITPAAPVGVAVFNTGPDAVAVSWEDGSSLSSSFNVLESTDGTNFTNIGNVPANGSGSYAFPVTGLTPDTTYSFEVETVDALASSPPSTPASATAVDGTVTANGSATVDEGATYTLNLGSTFNSDESATIGQYDVDWGDGSDDSIVSTEPLIAQHTFADGTDSADINVQAVTAGTTALPTFTMSLPTVHVDVIPNAPSDLTTTVVAYNEVDLSWTDNSDSAQTYDILRSDDGGVTYNSIGTADGSETSYQDGSVQPSSSYLYEVEAEDSAGLSSGPVSPADTTADDTPGAPVPSLTVAVNNVTSCAVLSWNYTGSVPASGYELEEEDLSLDQNFFWIPLNNTVPLIPGDQYLFRLRADLADGTVSPYTSPQAAAVSLNPGVELSADAYGTYEPDSDYASQENTFIELTLKNSTGTPLADQLFFYNYCATSTAGPGWVDGMEAPNGDADETDANGHYYVAIGLGQTGTFEVQLDVPGPVQYSNTATATEPGPEFTGPSDFTATPTSDTTISVSWSGQTPASGEYAIGIASEALGSRGTAVTMLGERYNGDTTGPTITDPVGGLTPGTSYDVMLYTIMPDSTTGLEEESWEHVIAATTGDPIPNAPAALHGTYDPSVPGGQVKLWWTNSSDNEDGFVIYRYVVGGTEQKVGTTGIDETTFIDKPKDSNGPFYYTVYAVNGKSTSLLGATTTVTVIGGPDITSHLFAIRAALNSEVKEAIMLGVNPIDLYNSFTNGNNPGTNWEIHRLWGNEWGSLSNSGIIPGYVPPNAGTVTVNGSVYWDYDVNYWLYGCWAAAIDKYVYYPYLNSPRSSEDDCYTIGRQYIILYKGILGLSSPSSRLTWFDAGYSAFIGNEQTPYKVPNVAPAPPPPLGQDAGPSRWYAGDAGKLTSLWGSN